MLFFTLGTMILFMAGCDQGATGSTKAHSDLFGTWIVEVEDNLITEENIEIWSIREDGSFSHQRIIDGQCFSANGSWQAKGNSLWINAPLMEDPSTAWKGTFSISGEVMTILSEQPAAPVDTLHLRYTDQMPQQIMLELGFCRSEQ